MSFAIAYVTFPNENIAKEIIAKMVEQRMAACGNTFPINSCYWWNNQVQSEGEFVGIIKTTLEKFESLSKMLEEIHPYDVPCIMKITVEANQAYEDWIKDCVK